MLIQIMFFSYSNIIFKICFFKIREEGVKDVKIVKRSSRSTVLTFYVFNGLNVFNDQIVFFLKEKLRCPKKLMKIQAIVAIAWAK